MDTSRTLKISIEKVWVALLILYIITGYLAQDVLLPARLNSIFLYAFLAFSIVAVACSKRLKLTPIVLWGVLFLGASFVAMLYSQVFAFLSGTYYVLIVNFIIILILSQMSFNQRKLKTIFSTYTLSGTILIVLLALTGNLEDASESGRLGQELVGNANILACMLMVSVMYGIWLFVIAKRKREKFLWLVAIVVIYIGMFLSGGRKYVVAPIIFAYIVSITRKNKHGQTHVIRKTLFFAVIVFTLYQLVMNIPYFYQSIGVRFEGAFALFDDDYSMDGSTIKRTQMMSAALKKWLENPVFGYGFDSFKFYNAKEVTGHLYYSHNNFVELLYNQGIVGFVAYYCFYIKIFVSVLKEKSSCEKSFVLGCIVSLLFFEYFSISYSAAPIQILLFFCMHFINSAEQEIDKTNKKGYIYEK